MSLVDGDAHQLIGVAHAVTLEDAVLGSVLFGLPTAPSVGVVIAELSERAGYMLYGQSFVDDPAGRRGLPSSSCVILPRALTSWDIHHCHPSSEWVTLGQTSVLMG